MALKNICVRSIIALTALLSFSLSCLAIIKEEEEAVYRILKAQWERVEDYEKPRGFDSIFQTLPRSLWPALPESYEWRVDETNHAHLYRHAYADKHDFDFVTYGTDDPARVNFLSRWDGITYHSFAYTRATSLGDDKLRNFYPMSGDDFTRAEIQYMRGHCIDFLDTQNQGGGLPFSQSISTLDARNYIPEPLGSYWGITLRTNLVGEIRRAGGYYAQYMHYPFSPLRTSNGTAIPAGIYFVHLNAPAQNSPPAAPAAAPIPSIVASYNISWADPIHQNTTESGTSRLDTLKTTSNFFPQPFVHDARTPLPTTAPPLDCTSFEQYHRLLPIADNEARAITAKAALLGYLIPQGDVDPYLLAPWMLRLLEHTKLLYEADGLEGDSLAALQSLKGVLEANPLRKEAIDQVYMGGALTPHLDFVCRMLTEGGGGDKPSFPPLPDGRKLRPHPSCHPLVYIDVEGSAKKEAQKNASTKAKLKAIVQDIIKSLQKNPPVKICLLNMTTARAKNLAPNLLAAAEGTKLHVDTLKQISQYTTDSTSSTYVDPSSIKHHFDKISPNIEDAEAMSGRLHLPPVEVDASGEHQEVADKILLALEENPKSHLILTNVKTDVERVISILIPRPEAQEKEGQPLKKADLSRLSQYTLATGQDLGLVTSSFSSHKLHASCLPPSVLTSPALQRAGSNGSARTTPSTPPIPLTPVAAIRPPLNMEEFTRSFYQYFAPAQQQEFLDRMQPRTAKKPLPFSDEHIRESFEGAEKAQDNATIIPPPLQRQRSFP